jgi:biopolymer transport protein ExbD
MTLNFTEPVRRPRGESIVPMINVVFLLLIFFMMTSHIVTPEPFEVTPPKLENGEESDKAPILFLSSEGEIGFEDLRGPAAVAMFATQAKASDNVVQLRADANVPATKVAKLLRDLAEAGMSNVALVVTAE